LEILPMHPPMRPSVPTVFSRDRPLQCGTIPPPFPPPRTVSQTRGYSHGRISYNAADYRSAGRKLGATAF
ncbi:hypothetical protein ALC57_14102, partial [Trachymyrmex cornetzi]